MCWDSWLNDKIAECEAREQRALKTLDRIESRGRIKRMTPQDIIKVTGQHLLFLGIGTYNWTLDQFRQCAQFAKTHDVDCLLIKTNEGALPAWYGGIGGWTVVKRVIQNEDVGAIPYIFSYGNKFGDLDIEIDAMLSYMQSDGIVCMNAEEAWNGQVQWAQRLCSRVQGQTGTFMVSTWADPSLQNWTGVIATLAPCTTVFMPQQYNNYLATFWQEFVADGAAWLQPTVDLTQEFGANDPVAIAAAAHTQGHTAISVWSYDAAVANSGLLDAIYAAFPKTSGGQNVNTYSPNSADFNNWFTVDANGNWICKSTNAVIIGGNKGLFSTLSIDGNTLPVIGLPLENEQYHTESDNYHWSSQMFERATMHYDPGNRFDTVPGQGASYLAHVNPPQTTTVTAIPKPLDDIMATIKNDVATMETIRSGLPTT